MEIKHLQSIEVSVSAGSATGSGTLSGFTTLSQMVPFATWEIGTTDQANFAHFDVDITSLTNITVTRSGSTSAPAATFRIFVVEFGSDTTVQKVSLDMSTSETTDDINISSVVLTDSFALCYYSCSDATGGNDADERHVRCRISTTTNVACDRVTSGSVISGNIYIIESDTLTVATYTPNQTAGTTGQLTTITSVVVADSFIIATHDTNETDYNDEGTHIVTFYDFSASAFRSPNADSVDQATAYDPGTNGDQHAVQIITDSGLTIQRGIVNDSSSASGTANITAVDLTKAIIFTTTHGPRSSNDVYDTTSELSARTVRVSFNSTTQIQWNRGAGGATTFEWFVIEFPEESGAYTIDADSGNYSLSGQDVGLEKSSVIGADSGAYNLTGQDVGLNKNYIISAESGSYNLTGQDTNLIKNNLINSESGNYNLTGQDTGVLKSSIIDSESGSYNITGQDVDFKKSYVLSAESGNYNITGQDVGLEKNSIIDIESGTYNLTGQDANLIYSGGDYSIDAESGSYNITGGDVNLIVNSIIEIESGSYLSTGQDAELNRDSKINIESDSYNISGNDAELLHNYLLSAESGNYILTGQDADLIYSGADAVIVAEPGNYNLTGQDVDLIKNSKIEIDPGDYILDGQDVELGKTIVIDADPGVYNLSGQDAGLEKNSKINIESGTCVITGYSATLIFSEIPIAEGMVHIDGDSQRLDVSGVGNKLQIVGEN